MLYTFLIDGSKFDFACDSVGTRSGFAHVVTLYKDNHEISRARVNYLNRTWEVYRYQSAMRSAVYNIISGRRDFLKYRYKKDHGISRVSQKIMEDICERDPDLILLSKLLDSVKEHR